MRAPEKCGGGDWCDDTGIVMALDLTDDEKLALADLLKRTIATRFRRASAP
jgi:hypothetical protein